MAELSPQEKFWQGAFGSEYSDRNVGPSLAASNTALFSRALARASAPRTVLELGANIGMNLIALGQLFPEAELHAVEINAKACDRLRELLPPGRVTEGSILASDPGDAFDLVLIKGSSSTSLPRTFRPRIAVQWTARVDTC